MPRLKLSPALRLQGRLQLARLLEMPEEEFAKLASSLERSPAFRRLWAAGAVSRTPFPKAYFAARRFAGLRMARPADGLGDLLSGESWVVALIRKAGRKAFEECFIRGEDLADAERARRSGLSLEEARRLRAWLERLYIRTEFEPAPTAPAAHYSAVAGIEIRAGEPCLRFFLRDAWKSRWRVEADRAREILRDLADRDRALAESCLSKIEFLNRRKTTLYRALEEILRLQAPYLRCGDPSRRVPLTQRSLAAALGADPSALNRLVSNKSVELPWGTEAPLKSLLPSGKTLALAALEDLARERPRWSDERLRAELAGRRRVYLSRRSIAQYRKDLGIASSRRRVPD